uniref:Uncharacterized protein n=1 Tax=viral metagenome TaxID=1070528 RepID=A0A6C0ECW7_9ZZZZ
MKILIILTGHRHNEEYKLYGLLLEKCNILSSIADIYIHSNCINNCIIENVQYIKSNKRIYITEKNAGFINGGLEAVSDVIDELKLLTPECQYDYVIHMHPDVFITDENNIINLLTNQLETNIIFYVNLSLNDTNLYSFDFFIFKPKLLTFNIFKDWKENTQSPEYYFCDIIKKNNIIHALVPRFLNNYYLPRKIDMIGLWHDHDLFRIYNYILTNEINLIQPIEYSIDEFIIKIKDNFIENTIWLEINISEFYKFTDNIIHYYDYNDKSGRDSDLQSVNNSIKTNYSIINDINEIIYNNINISLLHINYNLYEKSKKLLNQIKNNLHNNCIIIINNIYNYINGDFRAIYEFLNINGIKYDRLGLHRQSIILKINKTENYLNN